MSSPSRLGERRTWSLGSRVALSAALAATALVLIEIGRRLALGYDSVWHVFIAEQESWASFVRETSRTAHPPLYMLALRAAIPVLGDSLLAYRAISIVAILVSAWLVARLTARVTSNTWLGVVAAAAFGLSASAIEIGLEARSYALVLAFLLIAYDAYLDWLATHPARLPLSRRIVFAAASTAAVLTHYSALFFLAAAVAAPAILWPCARRWRARLVLEARRAPRAAVVMFGVPLTVGATAYALHIRQWGDGRIDHVPNFLWDAAHESMIGFVARNARNLVQLVVPDTGHGAATAALALLLIALTISGVTRRAFRKRLPMVNVVVVVSMVLVNLLAALAGRYPFGGYLRHEIFLFPFFVLAVVWGLHAARGVASHVAGTLRPVSWGGISTIAAAFFLAGNVWLWTSRYQVRTEALMQPQIDAFREALGQPSVVLTDRFNFIALYGHYRDWQWTPLQGDCDHGSLELWEVSRQQERFRVCRSPQWQLDLSGPAAYAEAAACLDGGEDVAVFRPQQHRHKPVWNIRDTRRLARDLGSRFGLVPLTVRVVVNDAYLSFRTAGKGAHAEG